MPNPFTSSAVARRPAIMWAAQRATRVAHAAIVARWALQAAAGAPATTAALLASPWLVSANAYAAAALLIAVATLEFWASTVNPAVSTWRKGWAFRRLWPARSAASDHGTTNMRASLGGGGISSFLQANGNLPRPVLNHPPLGWPRFNYRTETVTFRVHPPGVPGAQTVADIEQMLPSLIDGYHFATDITLALTGESWGWLVVDFADRGDALAEQVEADLDALDGGNIQPADNPTDITETMERHPTAPRPDPFPEPPQARHHLRPHYHRTRR